MSIADGRLPWMPPRLGTLALLFGLCFAGAIPAGAPKVCVDGPPRLEPDVRFGADDEDDPAFLLRPASVAVDGSGNVFVLDHARQQVLKFDPEGEHLETFSRSGEGPGELRSAFQLAAAPDGTIVVYDPGNRRVSFFDNDGVFERSADLSDIGYGFVSDFRVASAGAIYMAIRQVDFAGNPEETTISLSRFSPEMQSEGAIDELRVRNNKYITRPVRTNVPLPFAPDLFWDIAPSGRIVVARSADYSIRIFSAKGELLQSFRHERKRQKVTDEDREEHFAGISTSTGEHVSQGAPPHIRDATEFPRYKPYLRGITVDEDGNILVRTFESEGEDTIYDVFDPEGRFACRAAMPSLLHSAMLEGGHAYRITESDDELAFVQRYRLSGREAASAAERP